MKALIHQLKLFEEQICQADGRIAREMVERKSLIQTVPGPRPITATVIERELGDAKRFENANQVRAFAGRDPSVYPSGKFVGTHRHISKRRSPRLREGVYHAALPARRVNPACRELYGAVAGEREGAPLGADGRVGEAARAGVGGPAGELRDPGAISHVVHLG
ncbi:MAG: transposase [Thermoplasmata archaeon]